ncbi:Ras GTPase [Orbilia oligospora]|uniref:Ras GTPase n=1 Tax=Orbilia oligospora TaxID=2813651 RepID=A0A7C8JYC0_ORBOL|nr:Ras GTPase [Orbilia oligospora]KAF3253096.1 Ras GTPase [Orbilia oligospora]KAF3266955.1 Ras GTPase [Orbilia oligospora]KAF3292139.1 Ras GTPase [Orbilia oligospora]TGJ66817.1 Ras GTPase [Orbilia oligospora]
MVVDKSNQVFPREYKLVLLGSPGSGKWAFIIKLIGYRSCFQDIEDIIPRSEESHRKQCVIDDEVALLDVLPIYDTTTEFYPGWFGSVDGYIILYSIASRKSFEAVSAIYERIQNASGGFSCNILLAGNNCDMEAEREVSTKEGRALAESLGAVFFEVSTRAGINIDWSVYDLVRRIRRPDGPRVAKKENNKKEKEGQDEAEDRRKHSFRAASAWVVNKITKRGN